MDRSRDRYGGDMLTRSQSFDWDDFGETIARFAAPAERSFLERRGAAELQMRRCALMTRAQRLAGEHCGRRTTGTSSTSLGSCPASDFVELLGATRAETSGLARCHGAADELQNGCVQKTGCLKVILERTMASVPDWSEMRHSDRRTAARVRDFTVKPASPFTFYFTVKFV